MPALGTHLEAEIASQPEMWTRILELDVASVLPSPGERVAVVGCGSSWFMSQSYAALRESAGHGVTDAFLASEARFERGYDRVIALTRSGTTTELLDALVPISGSVPITGITGDPESPFAALVDHAITLPWLDERAVVSSRFSTAVLTMLRHTIDPDAITRALPDARTALEIDYPELMVTADQSVFLGTDWTIGLAHEAALKHRESSQSWTEAYPALDYRHGPIALAQPGRVTWSFGTPPEGLEQQVTDAGALFWYDGLDPIASLVLAHRVVLARARARGLDPDTPRGLARSVILD